MAIHAVSLPPLGGSLARPGGVSSSSGRTSRPLTVGRPLGAVRAPRSSKLDVLATQTRPARRGPPHRPRTTITTAASSAEPAAAPNLGAGFDWKRQWYVIEWLDRITVGVPYKFDLMDEPMVAFRREGGEPPLVFYDRCPHRRAPLSEGVMLADGSGVRCAYHGWEFSAGGECTRIPQKEDGGRCAEGHPGCAGVIYSAVEFQGKLCVWAEPGRTDPPMEALLPQCGISCLEDPDVAAAVNNRNMQFSRDMPLDMPILLENILDPDHGEYAHQVSMFDSFCAKGAAAGAVSVSSATTPLQAAPGGSGAASAAPGGADAEITTIRYDIKNKAGDTCKIKYTAPAKATWYRPESEKTIAVGVIEFYTVPVGVGRTRLLFRLAPLRMKEGKTRKRPPTWLVHLSQNRFLDQDTAVLAAQQEHVLGAELRDPEGAARKAGYIYRSASDKLLVAVGQFLDASLRSMPNRRAGLERLAGAGGLTEGGALPSARVPREVALDRGLTHADGCPVCQAAARNFALGAVAARAAAVAAAAAAVLTALGVLGAGGLWRAAVFVGLGGVAAALEMGARKVLGLRNGLLGYVHTPADHLRDLQKLEGTYQAV